MSNLKPESKAGRKRTHKTRELPTVLSYTLDWGTRTCRFQSWGLWGLKRISTLSEVTKLQNNQTGSGIQPCLTKMHALLRYHTSAPRWVWVSESLLYGDTSINGCKERIHWTGSKAHPQRLRAGSLLGNLCSPSEAEPLTLHTAAKWWEVHPLTNNKQLCLLWARFILIKSLSSPWISLES